MKLTKEQIQHLYKFTRQHYVEHYDVQTELVDHLANDIEQIWQEKPTLSFEDARTISFKKFGVFGFMDVVAERQKALHKKYWKILWRFSKEWFELPKIILTALIFIFFYVIGKSEFGKYFLGFSLIVFCVYGLIKAFQLKNALKNRMKITGKKWMLEEMIFTTGLSGLFMVPLNFAQVIFHIDYEKTTILPNWLVLMYATGFTFMLILYYVGIEVLPKKAEELLIESYPEYNLTST
jgi:uncharacterized membrane protein